MLHLCITSPICQSGTGKYQRHIYWLPWHFSADSLTGLLSIKSGSSTFTKKDNLTHNSIIRNGTYEWKLSSYMRIIGIISNKTGTAYTNKINSYGTSGLQRMYKNLVDKQMALSSVSTELKLDLQLSFEILSVNNVWVPVNPIHHGMVFADSESMDGAEYIKCYVDNNSSWYIIDIPKTSTESNGSFQNTGYTIKSQSAALNSQPYKYIEVINSNSTQIGATAVLFAKGVNKFTNLTLKGSGTNHIMLGYFINHDPSNATGYENAMHFQEIILPNNENAGTFYPLDSVVVFKNIANISIPGAKLTTNIYFGNAPNVEAPYSDSLSNLDALTQANLVFLDIMIPWSNTT